MKNLVIKIGLISLILSFALLSLTSCVDRSVHLMETDLSEGLIKIDYVNVKKGEDSHAEIDVYRTLDAEEQEYVLSEMNKIEFKKVAFAMEYPFVYGDGLVFYYTSYQLCVTVCAVRKIPYDGNTTGERLLYDIGANHQFKELLSSLENCEFN